MSHIPPTTTTDVVFIDALRVSANIGEDCWGKTREQPLHISVYLHLKAGFLKAAGESDEVGRSVHYGHLTKAVGKLVKERGFAEEGVDGLVREVAKEAFALAEKGAAEVESVRVVVEAPKLVLLAKGFVVDVVVARGAVVKKVVVSEMVVPVIIGVNPPERKAKQRVVVDLVFYEKQGVQISHVEYQKAVDTISKEIEVSAYLTLEKFVHEVARSACLALEIEAVTVRAKKPSALSFVDYSGVEVTRRRPEYLSPVELPA